MTELPLAKHPKSCRVLPLGAFATQFVISVEAFEGVVAAWVTPFVVVQEAPPEPITPPTNVNPEQ
jgi:hypothetical protein